MTYTKEFEEWAINSLRPKDTNAELDDLIAQHNHNGELFIRPHFWLSAFARLVREEAGKLHDDQTLSRSESIAESFNTICDRFKLEDK